MNARFHYFICSQSYSSKLLLECTQTNNLWKIEMLPFFNSHKLTWLTVTSGQAIFARVLSYKKSQLFQHSKWSESVCCVANFSFLNHLDSYSIFCYLPCSFTVNYCIPVQAWFIETQGRQYNIWISSRCTQITDYFLIIFEGFWNGIFFCFKQ